MEKLVIPFDQLSIKDVGKVGGKNASLGELHRHLRPLGIRIPDGFSLTAAGYTLFLQENNLEQRIATTLAALDTHHFTNLQQVSSRLKTFLLQASLPHRLEEEILDAYRLWQKRNLLGDGVAVRSSATAEDLPGASFAGQHDSFLNVRGEKEVLEKIKACFASLYNARAIKYRQDKGYAHTQVALSVGVQQMVRADLGSSGVIFTLDPESGFDQVIYLTASWGLGENIVQGTVIPDEYVLFKPSLQEGKLSLLSKKKGSKSKTMCFGTDGGVVNQDTLAPLQKRWVLTQEEAELLGRWTLAIEKHYCMPMDIEWAKDGISGDFFVVQARPETIHAQRNPLIQEEFLLKNPGKVLAKGIAVGKGITSGKIRILHTPQEEHLLKKGEILLAEHTNPDWDPLLKRAAAIVTTKGGRTSHAAIVARELGTLALVGAEKAMKKLQTGDLITLDNASGKVGIIYEGKLSWTKITHDFRGISLPKTTPMLILGDPEKAFALSHFPHQGVGLMRMEFVITSSIGIHPMALVHPEKVTQAEEKAKILKLCEGYDSPEEYFVDRLSQAIATVAAAFYPQEVILRMSDFKSNEYAHLLGGTAFEEEEENPMLGFRGAFRYCHERYQEGFVLECRAALRVKEDMGLRNLSMMIPFCRSPEEGKKVLRLLAAQGIHRGEGKWKIYVMAELPCNVIQAEEFAEIFDGFSIGSNDLTQLTLGIDRDADILGELFDETNLSVTWMIAELIRVAKSKGKKVGICGQAPSDRPDFIHFLISQGIDSISFQADALLSGLVSMKNAEQTIEKQKSILRSRASSRPQIT